MYRQTCLMSYPLERIYFFFFFQAEDGIRDHCVTGVQTCALPILDQPVPNRAISYTQVVSPSSWFWFATPANISIADGPVWDRLIHLISVSILHLRDRKSVV